MIKSFFNEFKKFAMRGNMIDMAVGIIIGAAFGKVVDSLVKDVIMPPLGVFLGKVDFSNLFLVLKKGAEFEGPYVSVAQAAEAGAITLNLGNFLNALVSFTIVAFAVFLLIKTINKLRERLDLCDQQPEGTRKCPFCFTDIPLQAKRCPHCTSMIENDAAMQKLADKDLEKRLAKRKKCDIQRRL